LSNFYEDVINQIDKKDVLIVESMSKHTSFKVGGPADFFITIRKAEDLPFVISKVKEYKLRYYVIGNGTNLLVRDNGFRGVIIKIAIEGISFDEENNIVTVGAGESLSHVAREMGIKGKKGFEYISGIPGTIGGAVRMNAGAYGTEIKDIIVSTKYMDENNEIHVMSKEEHKFDYRSSIFEEENWVILESSFKVENGEREEIENVMKELREKRFSSQPLDKPNAGSTFKRGDGFITAKLIDEAGLKGKKIGGAEISNKHAGFIVNSDNATADDIIKLIKYTKDMIKKKYGKDIFEEVIIIGE